MGRKIVVIGLGNILYGDEGFGVRVAEKLFADWDMPEHVEIIDGGTQGHNLLAYVEEAEKLLILDAVDFGLQPGEITTREGEEVPAYLTALKISPHQNSFSEVLGLAALKGTEPDTVRLIGVQPGDMHLGAAFTPAVRIQIDAVAQLACDTLREWGVALYPATPGKQLHHASLTMEGCQANE